MARKSAQAEKPVVFITHASGERRVAEALKKALTDSLGAGVVVFVSSDAESIEAGERWFQSVARHLATCVAQVILCSPNAITRPWVHFEAGSGWGRKIPVIPAYYAGVTERMLPDQFRDFEAVDLSTADGVKALVRSVARAVDLAPEPVRSVAVIKMVKEAESLQKAGRQAFPQVYGVSADIHTDLPQFIRSTRKSMVFCGIHFNTSLNDRMKDYLQALDAGVSLTMCAVKADSPAAVFLSGFLGIPHLSRECEITSHYYDGLIARYEDRKNTAGTPIGALSLRYAVDPPLARSYSFDASEPNGKILYVPYLRRRDSTQSPSFLFDASNPVFPAFVESALHHVESSEVVFDSSPR
jgi:hypothetical protein